METYFLFVVVGVYTGLIGYLIGSRKQQEAYQRGYTDGSISAFAEIAFPDKES